MYRTITSSIRCRGSLE